MTTRELVETDRTAWNDFVGANAYGDALQAWEWGDLKASGGDWRPLRVGLFSADNEIVGGAVMILRRLAGVGAFLYIPRGPVLGDWGDAGQFQAVMSKIKEIAAREKAAFVKIDPPVPCGQTAVVQMLEAAGFIRPRDLDAQGFGGTQPTCVMVLNIGGKQDDQLMAEFKAQCRRNIRIAQKKGVEVISDTTREDVKSFYDLLSVTAERDGFGVRPESYYEAIWTHLIENGLGKLFLTRFEGKYLSGALCFKIGDKCWYVYGASSNENRNVMPNYAMQWEMIRWAREQGCATYDFRGVSPRRRQEGEDAAELEKEDHLQGLNRFKEGFGAQYIEYIGEFDLPINQARYWLWTTAKPAAQRVLRRVRRSKK
jgi:lipid II:glycine glycyltransferase (peptidoglycan interpeptide bridge formation enzyme)